jgi:hypothetical protein
MKRFLTLTGAALAIVAAGIVTTPAVASAATVAPAGMNVCTTKYVKVGGGGTCWLMPSAPECQVYYKKVVTCTRY